MFVFYICIPHICFIMILIIYFQRESEKTKMIRDMEEKLITTAFYNFVSSVLTQHRLAQGMSHISIVPCT